MTVLAGASVFVILTRRYDLYYLTPLLIMVLYTGLFLGRIGHFCIRQRWIDVIGGMCYSIYLYHFMIIDLLAPWTMLIASPERSLRNDFLLQCLLLIPPILHKSPARVRRLLPTMPPSRALSISSRLPNTPERTSRP